MSKVNLNLNLNLNKCREDWRHRKLRILKNSRSRAIRIEVWVGMRDCTMKVACFECNWQN